MKIYKELEELLRTPTEDGKVTVERQILLQLLNLFDEQEEELNNANKEDYRYFS